MPKPYREFTINHPGFSDVVKLRLYKTAKTLREGAKSLVDKHGNPNNEIFQNAAGVFKPTVSIKESDEEGVFLSSMFGVILLCEEYLTTGIIAHECLHAAFSHERQINCFNGNFYECDSHEERFCYYYGWLLPEVLGILKKAGYKVK